MNEKFLKHFLFQDENPSQFQTEDDLNRNGAELLARQSSRDFGTGTLQRRFGRVLSYDGIATGGSLPRILSRRTGVTFDNDTKDLSV